MSKSFFIAGTDTDVGKTFVAAALLNAAKQKKLSTLGLKPVAAGCEKTDEGLRNGDALSLMTESTVKASYDVVNPIAFEEPIAPHIAAAKEGRRMQSGRLEGFIRGAMMSNKADFTLVEGAGGWRVPISERETLAEVTKHLKLPVILVVGMRLGCLNHALLTAEAIQRDGLPLVGWVANHIDPDMSCPEENFQTLQRMIPAPCLGAIPALSEHDGTNLAEIAAKSLDITPLLQG
ncbi:MAG: dethiobiotin synthase [Cellvibrionaceae bacterium]